MADIFEFSQLTDDATLVGNQVLKLQLESKKYNPNKVGEWIDTIGSSIVTRMREISPNFKYIVSSSIIQKVGAGVHFETSSYWDSNTDGAVTVKFESESLICVTTLFGIGI